MITCQKRQRMITNGKEEYRCINKKSDLHGQIVATICEECHFNKSNNDFNVWDVECGKCPRREPIDNKAARCNGTGGIVSLKECKICLHELIKYNLDPEKILREYNEFQKVGLLESGENKEYPSLITQVNNYRLAVTRWIKAGRPKRTDDEIKEIYEKHCKSCDWYDKETSRCKGCGCRVVPKGLALTNKLKMATEHCPQNLF